jgi:hypothetical protein
MHAHRPCCAPLAAAAAAVQLADDESDDGSCSDVGGDEEGSLSDGIRGGAQLREASARARGAALGARRAPPSALPLHDDVLQRRRASNPRDNPQGGNVEYP